MNNEMRDTNGMNNVSKSTSIQKKTASNKKTKTKTLTLRTTERQSESIAYRAKKNGYASVSAYARDLHLNHQTLKPSISNEYYARKYVLRNQLINDLYDLAANADQSKSISPETVINLITTNDKEMEKYEQLQKEEVYIKR